MDSLKIIDVLCYIMSGINILKSLMHYSQGKLKESNNDLLWAILMLILVIL